jgi:glutamate synthase (NADPH/NADH) large chain
MAYVYDPEGVFAARVNEESVVVQRLASMHWESQLHALITQHYRETDSPRADRILAEWAWAKQHFWQICPKEMVERLAEPLTEVVREEMRA